MMLRHALLAVLVLSGFAAAPPVLALDAAAACARLNARGADAELAVKFSNIVDAPTTILSARIVPATRDIPEICRVEGQIAPTIGFLLRMPTKTWNGKFMMGGCGGPCGNYLVDRIDPALVRGYAVVSTDMGHKGVGWAWAYDNLQGQIDFGYRATHVTAVAAKELIREFYSEPARRNYYWGCSTGGRQGMVEAQKFPHDFEGIVAGAPVYHETGDGPWFLEWNVRANLDRDGNVILGPEKLPVIHQAVLEACDAMDGLKDGILQNPIACRWDPGAIQCRAGAGDTASCLTPAQVDVVRKIYDGARNSKGEKLYWGMPRGSEDQWLGLFIAPQGQPPRRLRPGQSMASYMGFWYPPGPAYSMMQFDYDRDTPRLELTEVFFSALNPDLRRFRAAGGKLILFHGTHDNNIPVEASIDYYETATRVAGGEGPTKEFFRFFAPPGVNHCRNGIGGGEIDWITVLENWVEKGEAPDSVIAHHMKREPYPTMDYDGPPGDVQEGRYMQMARHPLDPASYDRRRPVYAYPDVAAYSGRGDPAQPESWQKAPRPRPAR